MIFKLKCQNCGNIVFYNSDRRNESYIRCSECDQALIMNIETKLNNVADMKEFKLLGVEPTFLSKVMGEDLLNIEKIYESSDDMNQEIISDIIDKIYLLLVRKDKNTNENIKNIINEYFYNTCDDVTTLE